MSVPSILACASRTLIRSPENCGACAGVVALFETPAAGAPASDCLSGEPALTPVLWKSSATNQSLTVARRPGERVGTATTSTNAAATAAHRIVGKALLNLRGCSLAASSSTLRVARATFGVGGLSIRDPSSLSSLSSALSCISLLRNLRAQALHGPREP